MNWLKNAFSTLRQSIQRWFDRPYRTVTVNEFLPKKLKKRTLYVVEEDGYEEQAAMLCPCGCGRILHMNLLPDERPCWKITHHKDGTSTLKPSVWRKKDCGSHFLFLNGHVHWCLSDPQF